MYTKKLKILIKYDKSNNFTKINVNFFNGVIWFVIFILKNLSRNNEIFLKNKILNFKNFLKFSFYFLKLKQIIK